MRIEPVITSPERADPDAAPVAAVPTGPADAGARGSGIGAGGRGMTPIQTRIARFIFLVIALLAGVAAVASLGVFAVTGEVLALVVAGAAGFAAYAFGTGQPGEGALEATITEVNPYDPSDGIHGGAEMVFADRYS